MATQLPKMNNQQNSGGGLLDYVVHGVENAANTILQQENPVTNISNLYNGTIGQLGNFVKDVGTGLGYGNQGYQQSQDAATNAAIKLQQKAQNTTDPAEKQRLLTLSQQIAGGTAQNAQQQAQSYSPDVAQNPLVRGLQTGANIAGGADMVSPGVESGIKAYQASPLSSQEGYIRLGANIGGDTSTPGTILNAKGEPFYKPPEEMGSYTLNPDGTVTKKMPSAQTIPQDQTTEPITPSSTMPPIGEKPPVQTQTPEEQAAAQAKAKGRTYAPGQETQDDVMQNTKRNLQYSEGGIETPKQKAQVNATLNGYGIKGTFDQQLQGISDNISSLAQAAQKQVAEDGGTTTKAELIQGMVHDLAYNGSKHQIPAGDISSEASNYINNVYVRAVGGDPTQLYGDVMPSTVPDTVVQKMKSIMNQDAAGTFGKDATSWTKQQQIARYARNSFDNILDSKHPEASILNNDMSDLYNAQESIMKGANKESGEAAKTAVMPGQTFGQKVGSFFKNPAVDIGLGLLGGGAGVAGATGLLANAATLAGAGIQNLTNPSKNQGYGNNSQDDIHGSSLLQAYENVKPDANGNIPLPQQTSPSGQYYTYSDFLRDTKGMSPNNPQYSALHQQYSDSLNRAEQQFKGNNKQNFMDNAQQYFNDAYGAKSSFIQVPPTLMNKLGSWKNIQAYINQGGQYAQQLQQVEQFNNEYAAAFQAVTGAAPSSDQLLDPALPPKSLGERWASMVDNMSKWYKQNLDPYLTITSSTAQQVPGGVPVSPTYRTPTSNSNISGMLQSNSAINGTPLPSINTPVSPATPNFQQAGQNFIP